jgi:formylglycine-generating enzyme required for sulfatase activity
MQCPYCHNQHPDGAQFCPVTGNSLSIQNATSKRLYMGLGMFSVLLMALSLFMLLRSGISTNNLPVLPPNGDRSNLTSQASAQPNDNSLPPTKKPTAIPTPTSIPTQTALPIPSPAELKVNQVDGSEIVFIPSGEFLMGSDKANDPYFWGAEAPEHSVTLGSYWIYRTEVTQSMYKECDEANACPAPVTINHPVAKQYGNSRFDDYPVVMVTWQSALAYCQWAGGRLPTEAEWEKAARGSDGRLFPWGNDSSAAGFANFSSSGPVQVGQYPAGSSPYGVYDMAGNVLEWVNDFFEPLYYEYSPLENPIGPASGSRKVIRGGAFNHTTVDGLRTVARASLKPTDTNISVGFRCVIDEP